MLSAFSNGATSWNKFERSSWRILQYATQPGFIRKCGSFDFLHDLGKNYKYYVIVEAVIFSVSSKVEKVAKTYE